MEEHRKYKSFKIRVWAIFLASTVRSRRYLSLVLLPVLYGQVGYEALDVRGQVLLTEAGAAVHERVKLVRVELVVEEKRDKQR